MEDKNLKMAYEIARHVKDSGGTAYFVGGIVRDSLMNSKGKDVDIEVHGITPECLEHVLDGLGVRTVMGSSFGVYGLQHYDLDIAMPRMETATGRGHKDFQVYVDPFLGTEKAARRRDFTINAMLQDILTGEIIDHYGGKTDLEDGVIRHVCDDSFAEDPLRVLRAAQFSARFGFSIAPETLELCRKMKLDQLPRERVYAELEKALLKAEKPSVFFEVLRNVDQLNHWFPELAALIGVEQDAKYHPEGDVWVHTMQVLDEAAVLRSRADKPVWYMLSAICHDMGKPVTTEHVGDRIHAINHEREGIPIVERFIKRISGENDLRKYLMNMVEFHMQPNILVAQNAGHKSYMRLFDRAVVPNDLMLLSRADYIGSGYNSPAIMPERRKIYQPIEDVLREKYSDYQELMKRPYVMGRDLIDAGLKPGPAFSKALEYAHKLRLAGIEKDIALIQTLAYIRKL